MPNPEALKGLVERYFDETPAEVVIGRAEGLRPTKDSEPLGILPDGVRCAHEEVRRTPDGTPIHNCGLASNRECQCSKCCMGVCPACIEAM